MEVSGIINYALVTASGRLRVGSRPDRTFQQGVTNLSPALSWLLFQNYFGSQNEAGDLYRGQINDQWQYQLNGGSSGSIELCRSILNLQNVNGSRSNTY